MWLITVEEWLGNSRNFPAEKIKIDPLICIRAYLWRGVDSNDGIVELRKYEVAYKQKYPLMAWEFSVIGLMSIVGMRPGAAAAGNIADIGALPKRVEDF